MKEWKEYRLGDIAQVKGGKRLPKGVNLIKEKNSHPYIRVRDLGQKKVLELDSSYEYVDDKTQKSISRYIVNSGDIIISIVGTIGLVAIIGKTLDKANLTENCVKLININAFNKDFLYYYLVSELGKNEIEKGIVGAVQAKLPIKNIQAITIKAPNLERQSNIAKILKSLDDKIEINRRINENLEQQAQALFKSWFVNFEPFKDGEFVESELGMIPKGWRVVSLGDLMCYNGGSQPPASEFIEVYKEGYIRFIQIRDYASDGHITYIPISKRNKLCDVKDIMIARYGASLGRICFGLKGAYNVALAKVTPLKDYFREYLRCFLNTREFYEGINNKGNRAVQAGFNQSDIQSFRLPFPTDDDIIMVFEKLCSSYFERRLLNDQESRRLEELRDTLLPKLMSGELKVNEPMN